MILQHHNYIFFYKNLTVYIADKWAESDINSNDSAISIFDMCILHILI